MTPVVSCMGGFCGRRESCLHYREGTTQPPAERLCEKGRDEPVLFLVDHKHDTRACVSEAA